MKKIKELIVTTPQGDSGRLSRDSRYVFNYTTEDKQREASLLMPIRAESYGSGAMLGPFTMNLPEGYLKNRIEERFAKFGGINDMQLLAFTGKNQIGRLRFLELESGTSSVKPQMGRSELLKQSATADLFEFLLDAYLESGISGVQPKVMLPDADKPTKDETLYERAAIVHSDLIVKASGVDFPNLAFNEFLCMTAAKTAGLSVPEFWLSNDAGLFVMERFDLADGQQLGFEDMAVLMDKTSVRDAKYQSSYEMLAKAVTLYSSDEKRMESLNRLFEYVTLSVMVRNGDAHLKNFGLLYENPAKREHAKLAPLYDVVTTSVYEMVNGRGETKVDRSMALKMNRTKEYPSRTDLLDYAKLCSVQHPEAVIERIADAMQSTLEQQGQRGDAEFLNRMKREWDIGRKSLERTQFLQPARQQKPIHAPVVKDANTQDGKYVGHVLLVNPTHIFQHIGKYQQVKHAKEMFGDAVPQQGQMLKISYKEGKVSRLEIGDEERKKEGLGR